MSFTQPQLDALEKAIASGSLRVHYADREVTYRSFSEMIRIRDMMRQDLGLIGSDSSVRYACHSKGLE